MGIASLRDCVRISYGVKGIAFLWGCDRISSGVMSMSSLRDCDRISSGVMGISSLWDLWSDFIRGYGGVIPSGFVMVSYSFGVIALSFNILLYSV